MRPIVGKQILVKKTTLSLYSQTLLPTIKEECLKTQENIYDIFTDFEYNMFHKIFM